jgi:hypothetical protein
MTDLAATSAGKVKAAVCLESGRLANVGKRHIISTIATTSRANSTCVRAS